MSEIFVSIDCESNGPVPGLYSMLSIGAVAFNSQGEEIAEFSVNLEPLPDAQEHPETMNFWKSQPEAWAVVNQNKVRPILATKQFDVWLRKLPGPITVICWPTSFDFPFVHYYLVRFTGESYIGHTALDIKSLAAAVVGKYSRTVGKKDLLAEHKPKTKHTHVAVEDAREQGEIFFMLRAELEKRRQEAENRG